MLKNYISEVIIFYSYKFGNIPRITKIQNTQTNRIVRIKREDANRSGNEKTVL